MEPVKTGILESLAERMLEWAEWKFATIMPGEPSAMMCMDQWLLGYFVKNLGLEVSGLNIIIVDDCLWQYFVTHKL